MTPEQLEHIKKDLEMTIRLVVNGKIDRIDTKIDTYIKEDNQWKADVKPYIESMRQFNGFTTMGAMILKSVMLIGGAVGVIYGLLIFIKNWILK